MKNLMCLMLVTMLGFSPMMAAVAEEAAIAGQESSEAVDQDDAWDEPVDIEYEEDGTEETEEVAGEEAEISPFVGEWLCDNASIYIDEGDGAFDIYIMWDISETETDIWEYKCTLDPQTGALTGEGKKSHEVIDEEGEIVSNEEMYTDGSAAFALEDDALIWTDAKEDIAQGMRFERGEEDELLEEYDELVEDEEAGEEGLAD